MNEPCGKFGPRGYACNLEAGHDGNHCAFNREWFTDEQATDVLGRPVAGGADDAEVNDVIGAIYDMRRELGRDDPPFIEPMVTLEVPARVARFLADMPTDYRGVRFTLAEASKAALQRLYESEASRE